MPFFIPLTTGPNTKSPVSIREARKLLGTTAKGLSNESIARLIAQVDVLTDIVVAHAADSIIQTSLEKPEELTHTNG